MDGVNQYYQITVLKNSSVSRHPCLTSIQQVLDAMYNCNYGSIKRTKKIPHFF